MKNKKLTLNKRTVANLNDEEMMKIEAGMVNNYVESVYVCVKTLSKVQSNCLTCPPPPPAPPPELPPISETSEMTIP